jgi:hypothetical protein
MLNSVLCKYCRKEITMLGSAFFSHEWFHRSCWNAMNDEMREAHVPAPVEQHKRDKNRSEVENGNE